MPLFALLLLINLNGTHLLRSQRVLIIIQGCVPSKLAKLRLHFLYLLAFLCAILEKYTIIKFYLTP
jgi:hypothetical protein